jgi:hypothetical protein
VSDAVYLGRDKRQQQEEEDALARLEERLKVDTATALSTREGRRFVWRWIEIAFEPARIAQSVESANYFLAARDMALAIRETCMDADLSLYLLMEEEARMEKKA